MFLLFTADLSNWMIGERVQSGEIWNKYVH